MTAITTTPFQNLQLLVGDGATPTENFGIVIGLTSKNVDWSADTVTSEVPDATDESLVSFQEKDVKSVGASLSGGGKWAKQNHGFMLNWIRTGVQKNIKVRYIDAASGEPEYIAGPAVLTKLSHDVEKGGRVSADVSIEFARTPTITNKP